MSKLLSREEAFQIGYVQKVHGLKGELRLALDAQDPQAYAGLTRLYLAPAGEPLQPMPVEYIRMTGPASALLKLAGVNRREEAAAWAGMEVHLPLDELPPLSGEEDFYYFEVIGAELVDEQLGPVGIIRNVLEMPGQDLLEVEDAAGKRHLVPITEAFIGAYDREAGRLSATLPAGLLEL